MNEALYPFARKKKNAGEPVPGSPFDFKYFKKGKFDDSEEAFKKWLEEQKALGHFDKYKSDFDKFKPKN